MTGSVAFIVVNWNRAEDTIACVRSILAMDVQPAAIYLVDNHSRTDDLGQIRQALAHEPRVAIVEAGDNLGYSGGNNLGLRAAIREGHDFLIVLNNDIVVRRNFLAEALRCADAHPEVHLWGYKQFYPGTDRIYAKGGGRLNLFTGDDRLIGARRPDRATDDAAVRPGYIAGSAMGIDARLIERVGAFDDDYFLYSEEADLCLRARRRGFRLGYCPQAVIEHAVASTTGYWTPTYVYYFLRNKLLFMRKNARWYHWPSFLIVFLIVYVSGFTALSLFRKPRLLPVIGAALRDAMTGRSGRDRSFS